VDREESPGKIRKFLLQKIRSNAKATFLMPENKQITN
jgi:hypothetical protein